MRLKHESNEVCDQNLPPWAPLLLLKSRQWQAKSKSYHKEFFLVPSLPCQLPELTDPHLPKAMRLHRSLVVRLSISFLLVPRKSPFMVKDLHISSLIPSDAGDKALLTHTEVTSALNKMV